VAAARPALVAKMAATAISLAAGFGGGVFSPSLFLGAMLGGAFGGIAGQVFPELSSGNGVHTIVGMGRWRARCWARRFPPS